MIELAAPLQGRRLGARFTLLEKLGSGGQGEVWRAHDDTRGIDIALKVPVALGASLESMLALFEREHAIASRLDHPSVLKVFPPHQSGDTVVLPMELATGGDLRRMRGAGYLDVIPVLLDIAQALEHAHERGIIHRDLKPSNVFFDARGRVKLADFGAAGTKFTTAVDAQRQGLSPFTASPEQLRGEAPTEADDIYGLGALAYELLSGYPPYYPHFDTRRAQEDPVPDLVPTRQVPPLLGTLVMRMLAKDRRTRPRSMREVIDELDAALNDTLVFDCESITDLTHGLPSAMVSGSPAPVDSAAPTSAATSPTRETPADACEEQYEGPDLGIIPELLVANALVVQHSARSSQATAQTATVQTPPPADPAWANATQVLAPQAGPMHAQAVPARTPQAAPSFLRRASDAFSPQPQAGQPSRAQGVPTPAQQMQALYAQSMQTPPQSTPPAVAERSSVANTKPRAPLATAATLIGSTVGTAGPTLGAERPLWETLQLEVVPRATRLEPMKRPRWPMVLLGALAVAALAAFYWPPSYAPQGLPLDLSTVSHVVKDLASSSAPRVPAAATTNTGANNPGDPSEEAKLQAERETFDRRLAALEARGAGVWGGPEFAMAKTRAAESVGAHDAGNARIAQERLDDASRLLEAVESKAQQALATQIAAGQKALVAGEEEIANQAFDLARRIDPTDRRITDGQRRTRKLSALLPLIADGQNAESARNYSRAVQDYSQALSLDPGSEKARAGLARANAAFGNDNYAKAVGSGFAALGAGRLEDARSAFEKARSLRPNGVEAADGLRRVGAALSAKGFASLRQRAVALEAQERWDEAVQLYDSALQTDPSLAFAQQGKNRAAARAELGAAMQALIDRPERLTSKSVREQARALLEKANEQTTAGPVLRSQIARLELLLPDYDKSARANSSGRAVV